MLAPDAEEEALDLLVAHVPFVSSPVMAFVRCENPVDAGCESHAPVRYLFLLIGPEEEHEASTRMAHALAGVMLDEPFVAAVADAQDADTFLRVFDRYLERVPILPHVHVPHVHGAGANGMGAGAHGPGGVASCSVLPGAAAATAGGLHAGGGKSMLGTAGGGGGGGLHPPRPARLRRTARRTRRLA